MSTRCSIYYDGKIHIYHEMSGKFAVSIEDYLMEKSPDYEGLVLTKIQLKAIANAILKHVDEYDEY